MKAALHLAIVVSLICMLAGCASKNCPLRSKTLDRHDAVATARLYFRQNYPQSFDNFSFSNIEEKREASEWAILYRGPQLDQWVCLFLNKTNQHVRVVARNFLDPNYKENR